MSEFPPCPPSGPIEACCVVAIPNTSEWAVVCPHPGTTAPTNVPVLTEWGSLLFGLLLVLVAVRRLR